MGGTTRSRNSGGEQQNWEDNFGFNMVIHGLTKHMGISWDFYVCMWFFQGHTNLRDFHSLNPSAATSIGCEKWGSSLQLPTGRDLRKRREKKKTIGETPSDILQGLTHHNEIFISQKLFHQEPKIPQALRSPSFVWWHWINDISVWKQPTLWWPLKSWSKRAQNPLQLWNPSPPCSACVPNYACA